MTFFTLKLVETELLKMVPFVKKYAINSNIVFSSFRKKYC